MKKRFSVHIPNSVSFKGPQWVFDTMVKDNHIHLVRVGLFMGDKPFLATPDDLTPQAVSLDDPQMPGTQDQTISTRFKQVGTITNFSLEDGQIFIDVETIEGFSVESPNWEATCSYTPRERNAADCAMHIVLKNIGGDDLFALSPSMIEVADVAP